MSSLSPCATCGSPVRVHTACPHCGGAQRAYGRTALVLGLVLAGCPLSKDSDTDPGDTQHSDQAEYGVAYIDEDEDGYNSYEDCDDADASIHPDAEETPGDGVDSNCDGEDDT